MGGPPDRSLEERLAELERAVDELRRLVRDARAAPRPPAPGVSASVPPRPRPRVRPPPEPVPAPPVAPLPSPTETTEAGRGAEWWLNRAGIGLLLLGVAFLFKYSVDQGWLTPPIRVAFGGLLGAGLAAVGLRVERSERWFTPVMLGGAAATWYITGFAAYQVFHLMPYLPAFGFMVGVTSFTLWASLRDDAPVLAVLAASGGFGTPFLLYAPEGTIAGLVGYTVVVLLGMSAVYLARGWRALLLATVAGGWGALFVGFLPVLSDRLPWPPRDQWALQVGVLVAWLATWAVPVIRAVRTPSTWTTPTLTVTVPLVALFFSREIWTWPDRVAGAVAMGGVGLYVAIWWSLGRGPGRKALASGHAVAAAVLAAIAVQFFLEGHTLLVTWAVEAAALHAAARHLQDRPLAATGHALFALVAWELSLRLIEPGAVGLFDRAALSDLVALTAAVIASGSLAGRREVLIYRLTAAAGLALLLRRELITIGPDGGGVVLAAWTLLAWGLHRLGRALGERAYTLLAHAICALVGGWLAVRFLQAAPLGIPVVNLRALLHLFVLAGLAGSAFALSDADEVFAYLMAGHVGFLGWFWYELSRGPGGEAAVSAAWGAYGIGLLIAALLARRATLRNVALVTLGVTVAKLFLIDLAQIEPTWRILLFLGFGAAFLVLSYYFRRLWNRSEATAGVPHSGAGSELAP